MSEIQRGAVVIVRTADNEMVPRRALGGVEQGGDFPVVWVCSEREWRSAANSGREPDGLPWPANDVNAAAKTVSRAGEA